MKINHMTPGEWISWSIALARYRWDCYATEQNGLARVTAAVASLVILIPLVIKLQGPPKPVIVDGVMVVHAWVQFIWYIVVLIVAAIVAYAMAPKPPIPEPGKSNAPVVEDGKAIVRAYGDNWCDDPMVLGFKPMGSDPIKKKGGKK